MIIFFKTILQIKIRSFLSAYSGQVLTALIGFDSVRGVIVWTSYCTHGPDSLASMDGVEESEMGAEETFWLYLWQP